MLTDILRVLDGRYMQIRIVHFVLFCSVLGLGADALAQRPAYRVGALTDDEQSAINSVRVESVKETVSFLSSDEMGGRNTPSPELDIATDYVAARLKKAGLQGGGPDGSFFQKHSWPLRQLPVDGIVIKLADEEVRYRGLLHAASSKTEVADNVTRLGSERTAASISSIVMIDEVSLRPELAGNPGYVLSMYSRRMAPLAKKGAKVILVKTAADSRLPELAARMAKKPMAPPRRFPLPCPIVLVKSVPAGKLSVTIPATKSVDAVVRNVIGMIKGSDPKLSSEAIIISAHLDHIGRQTAGQDRINNGADDNASGVTGVLLSAEAMAKLKQRPKRTIIFMTFWGEEKGLLGSKHFVKNPLWPLDRIVANINLEMIGRPEVGAESKAWMTGWAASDLGTLMAQGAKRANVEIFDHKKIGDMLYRQSDNYPFVQGGVIAHSFSAGSLHADYHQPSDEWEKLNLPHMTKVIQGLIAGALPIANGHLTPKRTK